MTLLGAATLLALGVLGAVVSVTVARDVLDELRHQRVSVAEAVIGTAVLLALMAGLLAWCLVADAALNGGTR